MIFEAVGGIQIEAIMGTCASALDKGVERP
jgi:hypothetical protein